jgi:hypothetical protein
MICKSLYGLILKDSSRALNQGMKLREKKETSLQIKGLKQLEDCFKGTFFSVNKKNHFAQAAPSKKCS